MIISGKRKKRIVSLEDINGSPVKKVHLEEFGECSKEYTFWIHPSYGPNPWRYLFELNLDNCIIPTVAGSNRIHLVHFLLIIHTFTLTCHIKNTLDIIRMYGLQPHFFIPITKI